MEPTLSNPITQLGTTLSTKCYPLAGIRDPLPLAPAGVCTGSWRNLGPGGWTDWIRRSLGLQRNTQTGTLPFWILQGVWLASVEALTRRVVLLLLDNCSPLEHLRVMLGTQDSLRASYSITAVVARMDPDGSMPWAPDWAR